MRCRACKADGDSSEPCSAVCADRGKGVMPDRLKGQMKDRGKTGCPAECRPDAGRMQAGCQTNCPLTAVHIEFLLKIHY